MAEVCEACRQRFQTEHPLPGPALARSLTPGGSSNVCRMKRLIRRLDACQMARVAVIGGSMTEGHACIDTLLGSVNNCSWPRRFGDWLAAQFPCWSFNVSNLGRGGWSVLDWVSSGRLSEEVAAYDVVLLDLTVNAQVLTHTVQAHFMDQLLWTLLGPQRTARPVVMAVQTFRTCGVSQWECDAQCPHDAQASIPIFAGTSADPLFAKKGQAYVWCRKWWRLQDNEMEVMRHYGVPVASYRDAVWPILREPPELLPCFWNGNSHPNSDVHQMVATVAAYAFHDMAAKGYASLSGGDGNSGAAKKDDCADQPVHMMHSALNITRTCSIITDRARARAIALAANSGAATASALDPAGTRLVPDSASTWPAAHVRGDWRLGEDVRGKPGWLVDIGSSAGGQQGTAGTAGGLSDATIAPAYLSHNATSGGEGHAVSFEVSFGAKPQLEVSFLRTYGRMGGVRVYVTPAPSPANEPENATAGAAGLPYSTAWLQDKAVAIFSIRAWNPERFSVPQLVTLNEEVEKERQGQGMKEGLTVIRPGFAAIHEASSLRYAVTFELIPEPYGKFKLLQITSC